MKFKDFQSKKKNFLTIFFCTTIHKVINKDNKENEFMMHLIQSFSKFYPLPQNLFLHLLHHTSQRHTNYTIK